MELTDSIYVVLNMLIMVRCGKAVLDKLGTDGEFTKCLHSKADLDENRRLILHFPQDNTIWSVGSGYGGNVLLSKKCMALRLASCAGPQGGLAGRAHADPGRRGTRRAASSTWPPRSPAPAARPTWPCSSRPRA